MSHQSEQSRCYTVQLQIDSFLDGELGTAEQAFLAHVGGCADCARELRYAKSLYESVLDLPAMDCTDELVDSVYAKVAQTQQEVAAVNQPAEALREASWWQRNWFAWRPTTAVGFAAVCCLALTVSLVLVLRAPETVPTVAQQSPSLPVVPAANSAQIDAEDVRAALDELNTAIDYLNRVGRQTEEMIGGRFVVLPLQRNVDASLRRASFSTDRIEAQGPI